MTDIVDRKTRSKMMSGIKGKNTKPEIMVRKALFEKGFRYRLHKKDLPGKPDLVLPKYNTLIFINGCFWHGHNCHLFKYPSSREDFWKPKIDGNRKKDEETLQRLKEKNWRIVTIWECALKGKNKLEFKDFITNLAIWLKSKEKYLEIRGKD